MFQYIKLSLTNFYIYKQLLKNCAHVKVEICTSKNVMCEVASDSESLLSLVIDVSSDYEIKYESLSHRNGYVGTKVMSFLIFKMSWYKLNMIENYFLAAEI